MDASNMLKPALARGELHVIGATTLDEYRRTSRRTRRSSAASSRCSCASRRWTRRSRSSTACATATRRSTASGSSDEAIIAAAELSDRYIRDRFLPDKAIDLIDQASARVRLRTKTKDNETKSLEDDLRRLARERDQATSAEDYDRARELKEQIDSRQGELEERKKGRQRRAGGDGRGHRRDRLACDRHPGLAADERGARAAAQARATAARTDRRPGRGGRGRRGGGPPLTRGPRRPEPAGRELPVPRTDGRRQDGARPCARRVRSSATRT